MNSIFCRLLIVLLFLMTSADVQAQSWQWGVRGGGSVNGLNVQPVEEVVDMATDKQGNVYTISVIEARGLPTLGNGYTPLALQSYDHRDILVASHKCNNTYRWHKVIGTDGNDQPRYIGADTLGHIFITGTTAPQRTVHFANDSTLPNYNKMAFVAAYDTSGKLLWLRYPIADTTSIGLQNRLYIYDMTVDANGTVNLLTALPAGPLAGSSNWVAPSEGVYMLRYNAQGTVIALTRMQITTQGYSTVSQDMTLLSLRMCHTRSGRWVIGGSYTSGPFALGGQPVTNSMHLASFRENGQLVWRRTNDSTFSGIAGRPVADQFDNIYVTGSTWNGEHINGETVQVQASGSIPMVWKTDSNGHTQWLSYATDNRIPYGPAFVSAGTGGAALALGNGEITVTGGCGPLKWGGQQLIAQPNTGYFVFIARLNSFTGTMIKLDSINRLPPGYNWGTNMVQGKNGSFYIGGIQTGTMYVKNDTLVPAGGYSDFFIAKYGYPCNCIPPKAGISNTGGMFSLTQSFAYTGTGSTDSVVWHFGDGLRAKGNSVTHTYVGGNPGYNVCAVAYNSCGTDMACTSVKINNVGVNTVSTLKDLHIYPNPANDHITISGAEKGYRCRLYTVIGVLIAEQVLNAATQQVNIAHLTPGMYIFEVSDTKGSRAQQRISKL